MKSFRRGDAPLTERIAFYCRELGLQMSEPADQFHYSAVFICWCMRQAGAPEAEFPTTMRHWEYAKRAFQPSAMSCLAGRHISDYAPAPGDLVHLNRDGGVVTYERARGGPYPYGAESGIVVDARPAAEEAHIVMANLGAGGTVGMERLSLDAAGLLVQRATDPLICVLQTVK